MLFRSEGLPLAELVIYGWMPSWLKRWVYRRRGYRISADVKIGFGAIVLGDDVEIDRETRIGMLAVVRAQRLKIGPRVRIGMMTVIDTYDVEIGEGTRLGNQVVIGGMQSPQSSFKIGRNCILMEWSFVNTTRKVLIGDDVGIGGHCLLFTHGLWPNSFEGFPVNFGPITIEDQVWLAWRVTVLPGVSIGQKTIVSSDACITKTLPSLVFAGGVPAKPLRENGSYIGARDLQSNVARLHELMDEFHDWVTFHGGLLNRLSPTLISVQSKKGKEITGYIIISEKIDTQIDEIKNFGIASKLVVSLHELPQSKRDELEKFGVSWFDIESKERSTTDHELASELEEFLRRSGLRMLKYGRWSQK